MLSSNLLLPLFISLLTLSLPASTIDFSQRGTSFTCQNYLNYTDKFVLCASNTFNSPLPAFGVDMSNASNYTRFEVNNSYTGLFDLQYSTNSKGIFFCIKREKTSIINMLYLENNTLVNQTEISPDAETLIAGDFIMSYTMDNVTLKGMILDTKNNEQVCGLNFNVSVMLAPANVFQFGYTKQTNMAYIFYYLTSEADTLFIYSYNCTNASAIRNRVDLTMKNLILQISNIYPMFVNGSSVFLLQTGRTQQKLYMLSSLTLTNLRIPVISFVKVNDTNFLTTQQKSIVHYTIQDNLTVTNVSNFTTLLYLQNVYYTQGSSTLLVTLLGNFNRILDINRLDLIKLINTQNTQLISFNESIVIEYKNEYDLCKLGDKDVKSFLELEGNIYSVYPYDEYWNFVTINNQPAIVHIDFNLLTIEIIPIPYQIGSINSIKAINNQTGTLNYALYLSNGSIFVNSNGIGSIYNQNGLLTIYFNQNEAIFANNSIKLTDNLYGQLSYGNQFNSAQLSIYDAPSNNLIQTVSIENVSSENLELSIYPLEVNSSDDTVIGFVGISSQSTFLINQNGLVTTLPNLTYLYSKKGASYFTDGFLYYELLVTNWTTTPIIPFVVPSGGSLHDGLWIGIVGAIVLLVGGLLIFYYIKRKSRLMSQIGNYQSFNRKERLSELEITYDRFTIFT